MPFPVVFSNEHDRFMEVSEHLQVSFPPLGMMPSFDVIDRNVTDEPARLQGALRDERVGAHGRAATSCCCTPTASPITARRTQHYFPGRLEQTLREVKHLGAREIYEAIKKDVLAFGRPTDDISLVVIKLK